MKNPVKKRIPIAPPSQRHKSKKDYNRKKPIEEIVKNVEQEKQ